MCNLMIYKFIKLHQFKDTKIDQRIFFLNAMCQLICGFGVSIVILPYFTIINTICVPSYTHDFPIVQ